MRPAFVLSIILLSCAASSAAATWDPRFGGTKLGDPGFNDTVHAIARDGATVYVAGGFWGVWRWNGSSWTRVGTTFASTINDLAVTSNHDIYAGGFFSSINSSTGSIRANHIARWDGSDWGVLDVGGTVLSTGLNQEVHALATAPNGDDVYVGGNFTQAGGLARNYVARWDGSTFQMVGNNLFNNTVHEILVSGNDVYFGGEFTLPFTRVAHYNGSLFEFMNGGPNGRVYGLALYNGELYAAGSFTTVGTGPAAGVARWDGTNWHAVASSLASNFGVPLRSLLSSGGYLYLMGGFSAINGVPVNNVTRWNGFSWLPLSTGAAGAVYTAASVDGDVWFAGGFASVGAWPA
ncbi:MAG: hypothetical protein OEY69_03750, partial [Candidatus Krumholzibacteria bacterium]|nr:hypothetical protein [Candidatus Krumholzibacteria bacterium]